MKSWMQKIAEQFELDWTPSEHGQQDALSHVSEERATLLFLLDTYSKHLFDTDAHPARTSREVYDEFIKELLKNNSEKSQKILFRLRQHFSAQRIEESTYVQKTFEDFRSIIWDFVDQLGEDLHAEGSEDKRLSDELDTLRDAVESNSIETLRQHSREFIDLYVELQTKRGQRKERKISRFRKSLELMKKKLIKTEAQASLDHLTKAFNRKYFDENLRQLWSLFQAAHTPASLVLLDIDHFKKINDTYGHDNGDCIIKECVRLLKEVFSHEDHSVCRIGGEEFAVLLPNYRWDHAEKKTLELMDRIRKETFVKDNIRIQFTVSAGIAQLDAGESIEQWYKNSDRALYESKHTGRNRLTISNATKQQKIAS